MQRVALLQKAGEACRDHRPEYHDIWVRVFTPIEGGKPLAVVVIDPDAPRDLEKCLVEKLSAASFPKPSRPHEQRFTSLVHFSDIAPSPDGKLVIRRSRAPSIRGLFVFGSAMAGSEAGAFTAGGGLRVGWTGRNAIIELNGDLAATGEEEGRFAFDLLVGAGLTRDRAFFGVRTGVSVDGVGEKDPTLPVAWSVPVELYVQVKQRARGWFRISKVFDESREGGSQTSPLDESSAGIMVRAWRNIWLGATWREQMDRTSWGLTAAIGREW
jgi:hypothetical protein